MANKIQYGAGKWFYLKDTRFIHFYLIVGANTHELFGFSATDALKYSKVDNDFDLDSDFTGDPLALQNHSSKGQFVFSCNENGMSAEYFDAVIHRQKTYAAGEIPTVGLKMVDENSGKTVVLPYSFCQKAPDGQKTNGFDNAEYTFMGWDYDDSRDEYVEL